ncbi:MAG: peptidase, partial [Mesorhizobium sp.]
VRVGRDQRGVTDLGDVTGLPKLLDAFAERGFGRALIEKIAYRNWISMLEKTIG